jgi:RNA polymerase sigma-70 factor (subfamily 1)
MAADSADSSAMRSHWFRRVRQGDPKAVAELLGWYRPLLRRMARGRLTQDVRRRTDESDVVQEVLRKAAQAAPHAKFADRASFGGWLATILDRQLVDARRRALARKRDVRREARLNSAEAQRQVFALALQRSLSDAVGLPAHADPAAAAAAVSQLPDHYRWVLWLRYHEGLTFEAIGARIERSAGAVRMLHNRAIANLQHTLRATRSPGDDTA